VDVDATHSKKERKGIVGLVEYHISSLNYEKEREGRAKTASEI
jgi:hypothetical protein